MKIVMICIARMGSSRLPGKVLMDLGGIPVMQWVTDAGLVSLANEVVVATTIDRRDDVICHWCRDHNVEYFRGSEDDVLSRFYHAAVKYKADLAIRVTCDCPFIQTSIIDQLICLQAATGTDYVSNVDPGTWPDGLDCEIMTMRALEAAYNEATSETDRGCVTTWIQRNRHRFPSEALICPIPGMEKERWVLDTAEDYEFCKAIAEPARMHSWVNIKMYLDKHPELRNINAEHPRNERFYAALATEELPKRSYKRSQELLTRASQTIPLAAQTFSKSRIQYPADSPFFISHGDGGYCFDVDGNRYVDLVGGLLPVILGHRDPDVDYAVRRQINAGISHSLATELEAELSELLCRHIPCAEMTRFGKNGTDVTTAAIRLARAYTGRKYVLSSGYHGWADWSVAHDQMRNRGVPDEVRHLTIPHFNRADHLWSVQNPRDIACVIVEPEGDPNFLAECHKFCSETDALLIFDEIITWPRWGLGRWGLGGAQQYYNIIPHLTCISKAMANGWPISALVGKREIMKYMERISYSGTFFGETASIAAAIATIKKLEREPVLEHLGKMNDRLSFEISKMIIISGMHEIYLQDDAPFHRIKFMTDDIKTLFIQEMAQAGVLVLASHNLSYAHGPDEITRVLKAYEQTFGVIADGIRDGTVKDMIHNRPIPAWANVRAVNA